MLRAVPTAPKPYLNTAVSFHIHPSSLSVIMLLFLIHCFIPCTLNRALLNQQKNKKQKLKCHHPVCFLGVSLGSLLGGILYDKFDGATTFRIYGIVSLGLFVLHFLVQIIIGRKTQYSDQTRGKD